MAGDVIQFGTRADEIPVVGAGGRVGGADPAVVAAFGERCGGG